MAKQDEQSPKPTPSNMVQEPKRAQSDVVYLEKDKEKKYPLQKNDLKNVIVYQYIKRKILEYEVSVPADHINPIGIYTPEDYERHKEEGGLFERLKLEHEVWHMPETEEVPAEEVPQT